jgi:hypothetical protein
VGKGGHHFFFLLVSAWHKVDEVKDFVPIPETLAFLGVSSYLCPLVSGCSSTLIKIYGRQKGFLKP